MKFAKVRDVKSPVRGTVLSAGIDFFVPNDFSPILVFPNCDLLIPSGIKMDIPEGFMLIGADKSGVVTTKQACLRLGREPKKEAFESPLIIGAKVIDADYTGEIHIHVINVGKEPVRITPGLKIAQFIIVPIGFTTLEEVLESELFIGKKTERGSGSFGSTGSR